MKSMKSLLAVLGLAASVFALPVAAQTNFYIGASVGHSGAKDLCHVAGGAGCDDIDVAWRALLGYQFNKNFAVEAAYHKLGDFKTVAGDFETDAWELVAVGTIPVSTSFSVYGKLGAFRGRAESPGISETNNAVTFGLGLQYDFTREVGLRGEWQRYPKLGGSRFGGDTDVDVWGLTVLYRFQ
jgi:OOP family OmpA-OmpF porin